MPFSGWRRAALVAGLFLFAVNCTSRPVALMQEAENLWFKNRYREAIRVFLQVVDRYPDTPRAETSLLRVGEIFMLNLSEPEKAIEYFTRLTLAYPKSEAAITARKTMAFIYEKSLRDYDHAVIQYQKLIDGKNVADRDKYQFAIGRCYYEKGDFNQAVIEYRTLIRRYPGSELIPETRYEIGNCYFVMNNCEEAVKQYRGTLKEYPDTRRRGDILLSIGVCLEEKEEYAKALQLYGGLLDNYQNRALIQTKMDNVTARMKNKNR